MVRKPGLSFIATAIAGSFLLSLPAPSLGSNGKSAEEAAQTVRRMEAHWQTLIQETDPERRKQLMAEHRKMMTEVRASLEMASGAAKDAGHGQKAAGMHHHHDVQHTMEMHSMMLDMMQ